MYSPIDLATLVDLEQIAAQMGCSQSTARFSLDAREDPPVATYQGRELWLADSVHDVFEGSL